MAATPDLKFTLSADTAPLARALGEATRGLTALRADAESARSAAGNPFPDPTSSLVAGVGQAREALEGLAAQLGGLATLAGIGAFAKAAVEESQRAEAAFKGLESVANFTGVGIGDAFQAAGALAADGLVSTTDATRALQNLLARGFNVQESLAILTRLKDAAAFNRASHLSLSEAVVTATEGIKNENSELVDNAGLTKNLAVIVQEYADSVGKSSDELTAAEKNQAILNGVMRETEAQVGNAARALEGLTGEQARAASAAADLRRQIGESLTPVVSELTRAGIGLLENFFKPMLFLAGAAGVRLAQLDATLGAFQERLLGRISTKDFFTRVADNARLAEEQITAVAARISGLDRGGPAAGAGRNEERAAAFQAGLNKPAADPEGQAQAARAAQRKADASAKSARRALDAAAREQAQDARAIAEAETRAQAADQDARLRLERDGLERARGAYRQAFEDRRLDAEAFYAAEEALQVAALEAEIRRAHERRAAALTAARAPDAGPGAGAQAAAELAAIDANLEILDRRIAEARASATRGLVQAHAEAARTEVDTLTADLDRAFEALRLREDALANQAALGRPGSEVEDEAARARAETAAQAAPLLARLREIAQANEAAFGGPAANLLAGYQNRIDQLTQTTNLFAANVRDTLRQGLGGLFADLGSGAKSIGEAFRDAARSIAQSLNRLAAEALSKRLFDSLLGSLGGTKTQGDAGGFLNLLTGLLKFSSGGLVRGPGTGVSDSIPALVSNGEYVLSAAAVRRLGVGLLDGLNGGAVRPRRAAFSAGGLVDLPAPTAPVVNAHTRVVNVLDPGLVADYLATPGGERAILNIIGRNPRAVRGVL